MSDEIEEVEDFGASTTTLTNAQYFSVFANWSPNTGTTLPVPKLNITTYNTLVKQVDQHNTRKQQF